jgi:hypothetical protein
MTDKIALALLGVVFFVGFSVVFSAVLTAPAVIWGRLRGVTFQ